MVVVAIGLVLLVLIVLLLPFLLDLNRYRDQYLPVLEQVLHRKVEVEDVRLTLFPTLGIQLRKVVIADDPTFSHHQFLSIPSLHVAVQWKPLLQRRIEVKSVVITHPIVQIIRSAKGTFNISTMGKVSPSGPVPSGGSKSKDGVSPLFGFLGVKEFSLTGGTLQFEDRMHQPSNVYQIEHLAFDTESVAIGQTANMHVQGLLTPFQTPFDLTGRLGPLQANLDIPHLDIDGHVGNVSVTAKGKMSDGQLTADIHIPKASTDDMPIDLGLKKSVEIFELQAHLMAPILSKGSQTSSGEVLIDPFRMNLQMGQSTIHLSGKGTPSQIALKGDSSEFSSDDFPVPLSVQQPFSLEHIQFAAEIQRKSFHLQSFRAKAFGGTLIIQGVLDTLNPPLTFSTQGSLNNFSVETLMKVLKPSSISMTGAGELEWKVVGRVPSSTRPEFDGPTHLTIQDGAIIGFDLVKAIEDALQIPGVLGASMGTTPFSQIDAKTELKKEGLAIQEFTAHAPNFSLRSVGMVGLDQSVNLQGRVSVPPVIAEKIIQRFPMAKVVRQDGQLVLPFVIRGTTQDPKLLLDTQLLGKQVQKKVEERLEKALQGDDQELQKLLEEGKDLLKHFFRQ